MIILQMVVLTTVASCQAKFEHLGEPVPQRIKPHGQRPAQQHPMPENAKPTGPSHDNSPDPLLQHSSTLTRNQPDASGHQPTDVQRDDTSKDSDLENKLMTEQVRAHGRKQTGHETKSQKSMIETIRGSLKQSPNPNYPDRFKDRVIRRSDQQRGFDPMNLLPSRKMRAERRRKRDLMKVHKSTSNTLRRSLKQRLGGPSRNHQVAKRTYPEDELRLVTDDDLRDVIQFDYRSLRSIWINMTYAYDESIDSFSLWYKDITNRPGNEVTLLKQSLDCHKPYDGVEGITCDTRYGSLKGNRKYQFAVVQIDVDFEPLSRVKYQTIITRPEPPAALDNYDTDKATRLGIMWNKQPKGEFDITYEIAYWSARDGNISNPTTVNTSCISKKYSPEMCKYEVSGLKRYHPYNVSVTAISTEGVRATSSNKLYTPTRDSCVNIYHDCKRFHSYGGENPCDHWSMRGVFECLRLTGYCCPSTPKEEPSPVAAFKVLVGSPTRFLIKWTGNFTSNYTILYKDITTEISYQSTSISDKEWYENNLTELVPGRTYNIRMYAENEIGSFTEDMGEFAIPSSNRTFVVPFLLRLGNILKTIINGPRACDQPISTVSTVAGDLVSSERGIFDRRNLTGLSKIVDKFNIGAFAVFIGSELHGFSQRRVFEPNILMRDFIIETTMGWGIGVANRSNTKNRTLEDFMHELVNDQHVLSERFANDLKRLGDALLGVKKYNLNGINLCSVGRTSNGKARGLIASAIVTLSNIINTTEMSDDSNCKDVKGTIARMIRRKKKSMPMHMMSNKHMLEPVKNGLVTICNIPEPDISSAIDFLEKTMNLKLQTQSIVSDVNATQYLNMFKIINQKCFKGIDIDNGAGNKPRIEHKICIGNGIHTGTGSSGSDENKIKETNHSAVIESKPDDKPDLPKVTDPNGSVGNNKNDTVHNPNQDKVEIRRWSTSTPKNIDVYSPRNQVTAAVIAKSYKVTAISVNKKPIDDGNNDAVAAVNGLNDTITRLINFTLNDIKSVGNIADLFKPNEIPIIRGMVGELNPAAFVTGVIEGLKSLNDTIDYTNTKTLLTALLNGQGSTKTSEEDIERAYNKGMKVVTEDGGIGMVNISDEIIEYVDRFPGQTDISTIETDIRTGVGAYLNEKVTIAADKVDELKRNEKITNAIIEFLTYGHNKTMSQFTEANIADAKEYTKILFRVLDGAFGNSRVFDFMKTIADQHDTMKAVASMLHNQNNGYNVGNLAKETAKCLVSEKSTGKPSKLVNLFNVVGNGLVTIPSDKVSTAIERAENALKSKMKETKITDPVKFGSSIKGKQDDKGAVIGAQIFQALRESLSNLSRNTFIKVHEFDKNTIKKVFKAFILVGSGKKETKLNEFVEGLVDSVAASNNKSELQLIQSFVKNSGLTASAAGETAARNDYLGNNGKNLLALFNAITEVVDQADDTGETVSDDKDKVTDEDILNNNLKTGKVTPQEVANKIGNNSEIINGIKKILPNVVDDSTTASPAALANARRCIDEIFEGLKKRFPDKSDGKTWDSGQLIANVSLEILEHVARMQQQQVPCDQIANNRDPDASKTFLNKLKGKMLESFPAADPSNIADLKKKFEKMFAELKKYADKQKDKNYTTFGETFGKDQGEKANTALQSIVDSMKLTLKTRRKRQSLTPSPAAINAMNGFVNTILSLIGLNTGTNPDKLRNLMTGIAHGTTQPAAAALNTEAGPQASATTKGGNGATKDVGINSGTNSGNMADALQEGLSNMNAGDDTDDDDEGDSLWWIGLIIGILLLIIIIIVVILLLRRRKKEEPVEPEIDVIAVAADTVSETMTTYGAEMAGVVMTSVVTTTTTHYQPGDPETEPTQLSEEVVTGVGGEQIININVIHVNQDKEESSTDDVDSDADAHTDGHMLTDTEQSEVLYNADGTKQEPKEKKEKKRIKKSEKKKKMEEKQKKLDENKDQVEQKKPDDETNKDTQPQIIIVNEGQPKSGEKEMKNENENEVKEKEKSAKKDETGQIIIIHHQYDGPKSKETDQVEKPKSQQEKDEIQKNENKVTSKKESITKLTTNQQEGQPKIGDEENKVTRKESATKSAAKPETSSKQKAEDDQKDTKNEKPVAKSATNIEGNQLRTANDDDKQAKRRESTTKSAAKPTENDKKSKRDGSRTQVSQKPGGSKSQIGSAKKTNQNELTTKSKAKTDDQKSDKLKSEKSKFDSADVKANENKSKTQEMQREFQQSDTKQTPAEPDQINKSTHQQTAYEKEKALYAEPNYETVVHQAQQPTAQLHVGQAKDEGKENVVTKKVITVTTITTTNQEEGKK